MVDDKQLERLAALKIPTPDAYAREKAIKAALDDVETVEETSKTTTSKNFLKKFQGFFGGARLTSELNQQRTTTMSDQPTQHPKEKKSRKPLLLAGTAIACLMLVVGTQQGIDYVTGDTQALSIASDSQPAELFDTIAPASNNHASRAAKPTSNQKDMANEYRELLDTITTQQPAPATTMMKRAAPAGIMAESFAPQPQLHISNDAMVPPQYEAENRDTFEDIKTNPIKLVKDDPVSTFSIDVDTSSYAVVRRSLNNGMLPQKDAVRVEEMINYFDYDYPVPDSQEQPFQPTVAVYPSPWNPNNKLIHIGIKGHEMVAEQPAANLVFLLDVSGSMNQSDKLPLLKNAFRLMVENLQPTDTVSIVTYAGNAGTVLEPTKVAEKEKILAALDNLYAGGSTAGAQGIKQAYALAKSSFKKDGINRVMLATDGDFNVGITDRDQLKEYIERQRDSGIFLSVLGFGQGNYNDALMQTLAQNGNGNAAYIDTLNEARKVLVEEASSTLYPIAKDVKIQVEFNPERVSEYRLIGYENRMLRREDFNNDKIDAGEIGAGHTVTAIYEITPVGSKGKLVDDLRYGEKQPVLSEGIIPELTEYAFLKMRYKLPEESNSTLLEYPINARGEYFEVDAVPQDIRFAAAVAGFGQLLRGGEYFAQGTNASFDYDAIIDLAKTARGDDPFGYRSEFLQLVRLAKSARQ